MTVQDSTMTSLPFWAVAGAGLTLAWGLVGLTPALVVTFVMTGLALLWCGRSGKGPAADSLRRLEAHMPVDGRLVGMVLSALAAALACWVLYDAFASYPGESWQLPAAQGARLPAARPGSVFGFCLICLGLALALVHARVWLLAAHASAFVAMLSALFILCGHGYAKLVGSDFPVVLTSSAAVTSSTLILAVATFMITPGRVLPPVGRVVGAVLVVLVMCTMLLAWRAWDKAQQVADSNARAAFERQTELFQAELRRQVSSFDRVLRDSAALVAISPNLSRQDWQAYVRALSAPQTLPGVQGIGYARRVPQAGRDDFIKLMRMQGVPDYHIWPPQEREDDVPVTFLEPQDDRNRRALGYNLNGEPARRQAMECAARTWQPCATGKIVLVQEIDGPVQPGFLAFMPIHEHHGAGSVPVQANARPDSFTYMPFRMNRLMDEVRYAAAADVSVEIHDGDGLSELTRMYRSPGWQPERRVLYTTEHSFPIFGRTWTLSFRSNPPFDATALASRPSPVRYGLSMILILSFACVCVMVLDRSAALTRSNAAADELRQLNDLYQRQCDTLAKTNDQLEAEMQARSQALREKETLLKEVYHRVKNNLQVIQSLLSLQSRSLPAGVTRDVLQDLVQRIRSMSLVHEKLYQSGDLDIVPLQPYVRDLVKQLGQAHAIDHHRVSIETDIAPLNASLDSASPLGLLLNELVSNCLKHAFSEGQGGRIRIVLQGTQEAADLIVEDDGKGLPDQFNPLNTPSMGLKLSISLAQQLGGDLVFGSAQPRGTRVHIQHFRL